MDRSKKISNNCGIVRSTSESLLKRTPSSVNVAVAKSDLYLKDTKTFGTSDDHHIVPLRENDTIELEHGESLLNKMSGVAGTEVKTTDLLTNETFVVKGDALLHKGRRYTFQDIAPKWKKDCRMWLWKNKVYRKGSVLDELERNFENVRI